MLDEKFPKQIHIIGCLPFVVAAVVCLLFFSPLRSFYVLLGVNATIIAIAMLFFVCDWCAKCQNTRPC